MVSGDFADLDAHLAGQLDDGVAGDAFEDAGVGGRREELALADQEDVVAGALGHFALVVEHQGLDAAGLKALDLGQDVVQVVQRLDPRAQRGRMVPRHADGDDLQPLLVQFVRIERDRGR